MMIEWTAPVVSAAFAAILAITMVIFSLNVSRVRASEGIWFDDGNSDRLARARRAHFTLAEYSIIFLVVLICFEMLGGNTVLVASLGAAFSMSRVMHMYGHFALTPHNPARVIGSTISHICTLVPAVSILAKVLS